MTYKNNYDTSSTGINIEAYVSLDTDLSQIYFNDNFTRIEDRYADHIYHDPFFYDNLDNYDINNIDFTLIGTRTDFLKCLLYLSDRLYMSRSDVYLLKKAELEAEILEILFQDGLSIVNREESDDFLFNFNEIRLAVYYNDKGNHKEIQCYKTRGYNQGDVATVFYVSDKQDKMLEQHIDNLFWKTPINAKVIINKEEYYYENDEYEWHKDSFIKFIEKQAKLPRSVFENMIPDYPDYQ